MPVVDRSTHREKARRRKRSIMGIGERGKQQGKADGGEKRMLPLTANSD